MVQVKLAKKCIHIIPLITSNYKIDDIKKLFLLEFISIINIIVEVLVIFRNLQR